MGRVSVELEEIRASPHGGPAGTGPREQGPRAGAAPGGPSASLDRAAFRD